MRYRKIPAAITVCTLCGLVWFAVSNRGSAQAPARLDGEAPIETISVDENGNPVNNGYPNLIRDRQGHLNRLPGGGVAAPAIGM